MPVRWFLLLGMAASVRLPFAPEVSFDRHAVLAATVLYTAAIAILSRPYSRLMTPRLRERLLLLADLLFSAAIFLVSGGILSPYFGLLFLALIHAALLLGPRLGLGLSLGMIALIVASESAMPGGRGRLRELCFAFGKLPFLPLTVWACGRLAQEVRDREMALLVSHAREEQSRHEMAMASAVQMSLLPAATRVPPGLTVVPFFCPAREVGGDIYDLVELPDGRLLVAIVDVCGKGMPAALLTAAVQQGIRRYAQPDPAAVLAGVNQLLLEKTPASMFVTAACLVVDPRNGSAAVARAGHPPPFRWDSAAGRLVPVGGRAMALGLEPDWFGSTECCQLSPGDVLILYTDGVTDVKINEQERLGEKRLTELLERTAPRNAEEWVDRVRGALADCPEWPDDVTVIAMSCQPSLVAPGISPGHRAGDACSALSSTSVIGTTKA